MKQIQVHLYTLLFVLLITIIGCGGSSSSSHLPNFEGRWDVRYNFIQDECQLALSGIQGIVDQHVIEPSANGLTFTSLSGLLTEQPAAIREDTSLAAEELLEGDVFDIGLWCELRTQISYTEIEPGSAETLLVQTIACEDGFACRTEALGHAARQPEA